MTLNCLRSFSVAAATLSLMLLPHSSEAQLFGSDPEGLKRTDKLIEKAETTVKSAGSTREELQKTLDSYNAMFKSPDKDVRDAYKGIEKGIERTEKKREEVKTNLDLMKGEADAYFVGWKESLKQIQNPDLRKKSEDRMAETRQHFDGVLASVEDARGAYEPLIKNLKDQWTYLGHDLNAQGLTSLKPEADKLNTQSVELFKKIDSAMKKANDYIASLKSSRPKT